MGRNDSCTKMVCQISSNDEETTTPHEVIFMTRSDDNGKMEMSIMVFDKFIHIDNPQLKELISNVVFSGI